MMKYIILCVAVCLAGCATRQDIPSQPEPINLGQMEGSPDGRYWAWLNCSFPSTNDVAHWELIVQPDGCFSNLLTVNVSSPVPFSYNDMMKSKQRILWSEDSQFITFSLPEGTVVLTNIYEGMQNKTGGR